MKRLVFSILFVFCSLIVNAQFDPKTISKGNVTGKKILKQNAKYISKGVKGQMLTFFKQTIDNDTLQFESDMFLKYTRHKFGFKEVKNHDLENAFCNFYEFTSDCNVCGQRYLDKTLGSNKWSFRQQEGNKYISDPRYRTNLEIKFLNKEQECLIFTFTLSDLSENEYKTLYNSLPK